MKIKKTYIAFATSMLLASNCLGENEFDINQVNQKISSMIELKLHFNFSEINVQNRQDHAEFAGVKALCQDHWQEILENLDKLAGEKDGRMIVWEAMQHLPPEPYMNAFEWMVNKVEINEFDKKNIESFMNARGTMINFLADNYQHSRVIDALNKLKANAVGDEKMSKSIDEILSGEAKIRVNEWRELYQEIGEHYDEEIILPE